MKTTQRFLAAAIAAAALTVAGVAGAHPGYGSGYGPGNGPGYGAGGCPGGVGMGFGQGMGPGMGYGMGGGPGRHLHGPTTPEAVAAGLAGLKSELRITAEQEAAWQKYEEVLRQQAEAAQTLHNAMQAQMQEAKPAEAAALRESMFKQREAQWTARAQARNELYAVLTPEQKTLLAQRDHGGAGRRMSMGGPRW